MIVRLYEAKWKHILEQGLADRFRTACENDDVDGAVELAIEVLKACKAFFDPEDQDYVIDEIDELIDSFEWVDHEYDEVDYLLDQLYDFCDGYNIWVPLPEEGEHREGSAEETPEPASEPEPTPEEGGPAPTPAEEPKEEE